MTDARSQLLLEFPEVRARLADQTAFPVSRRLAEALAPTSDPVLVARMLDETDEARAFLAEHQSAGVGGARDIGPSIERAARGGRLETQNLLEVSATLEAAARLGEALAGERRPLLRGLGREIQSLPALRNRLVQSIDPAGELLDSASPALGGLRRQVRIMYERLRARLETIVHSSDVSSALQEPIITLRNGRYVVPVRAEARARVKGIVHDQSGSGQTLFIEPLVVVELGNAWREAQLAVEVEEERILDELSGLVGAEAVALRATLDALGRFDFWAAKARLAGELNAIRPEAARRAEVELLSARHPGLGDSVVPIDVRLGGDYTALVITGPNTGGKTVSLRTIGLLALMHQAGLHIPVSPGSRLPIFPDVFADIGDEQSIAQSLSTFSSHLRSIVRIVETAPTGSLVLLDELGAGTDPTEGSALAQALLDHFIRAGMLVVATTHYAELKAYAHNTPGAMNASVDFDLETLSPTYHLSIGLPGTSQAFAIAERLGLPAELVTDARSRLSQAQQEFEATLASIKAAQATATEAVARASEAEARAAEAKRNAELERARARRERDDAFMSAREEAERALAAVRTEIRTVRETLERESLSVAKLDELGSRLDERLAAIPGSRRARRVASAEAEVAGPTTWAVGMRARAPEIGWEGTIASIDRDGEHATLEAGSVRVAVPLSDLEPADGPSAAGGADAGAAVASARTPRGGSSLRPSSGRRGELEEPVVPVPAASAAAPIGQRTRRAATSSPSTRHVATTLDVRGARVDEALELLDRYLNDAAMASAGRITVVHGHGAGALRDAVRATLSGHPLVRKWRPGDRGEGGDGATIVEL
jgi:DNA mismatch repair protein MutS2